MAAHSMAYSSMALEGFLRIIDIDALQRRIQQAGRAINDAFAHEHADGHLAQFVFDRAEVADRLSKLGALVGVLHGIRDDVLGAAHCGRAELEAADVENIERDLVPFAGFAQQIFNGHTGVFQDQSAGG